MKRVLKKNEIVDELNARTGFYKKNLIEILMALDDIIVENMKEATEDCPSEMYLSNGFVFGGRYSPSHEVRDPRNGNTVVTPAKFIPYARFKTSFRKKINHKQEEEENE